MDTDLPYSFDPAPPPMESLAAGSQPPAPEKPREPVWTGLELIVIVVLTGGAIIAFTAMLALLWGLARYANGIRSGDFNQALVALTLLGQTSGLALGFVFAWLWIAQQHGARFWQAIHWRALRMKQVVLALIGGAATMVGVQILAHFLPIPSDLPMDRLFTPQTAWMLVFYGVLAAPFFEEFFFRGLLYPSLLATFQEGMTRGELRRWSLLLRIVGLLGGLLLVAWHWRARLMGLPFGGGASAGLVVGLLVCLLFLVAPALPLIAADWAINRMAGWRRPELLAILITGLLFGLLHAAQLGWAWAAVLILVLVGIALTAVRAATGSLIASWLFHAAYNGTLFGVQYVATQGFHHFPPGLH